MADLSRDEALLAVMNAAIKRADEMGLGNEAKFVAFMSCLDVAWRDAETRGAGLADKVKTFNRLAESFYLQLRPKN